MGDIRDCANVKDSGISKYLLQLGSISPDCNHRCTEKSMSVPHTDLFLTAELDFNQWQYFEANAAVQAGQHPGSFERIQRFASLARDATHALEVLFEDCQTLSLITIVLHKIGLRHE